MQKVVIVVVGIDFKWGDEINVMVMDFFENQLIVDVVVFGFGIMEILMCNFVGIINLFVFIIVVFLIVWFGFCLLVKFMGMGFVVVGVVGVFGGVIEGQMDLFGFELLDFVLFGVDGFGVMFMEGFGFDFGFDSMEDFFIVGDDLEGGFNCWVKEGLEWCFVCMVEISEECVVKIFRKWVVDRVV